MKLRYIFLILLLPCIGAAEVLVDYGSSASGNAYGSSWSTPMVGPWASYGTAGGRNGLIINQAMIGNGYESAYYMGVRGTTARQFVLGDRVAVTLYNNSDQELYFAGLVSFTDANGPVNAANEAKWFGFTSVQEEYTSAHGEDDIVQNIRWILSRHNRRLDGNLFVGQFFRAELRRGKHDSRQRPLGR
jgi:hypothetical protein